MNIGPIHAQEENIYLGNVHLQHPRLGEGLTPASTIFYVTFIFMMLFFFMVAAASEKYKPAIGHETSYTIIMGLIVSLILWFTT
jgi:hypothetical protein